MIRHKGVGLWPQGPIACVLSVRVLKTGFTGRRDVPSKVTSDFFRSNTAHLASLVEDEAERTGEKKKVTA